MKNKNKIENLRTLIRTALNKHIDGDYVLLDVPNHRNIGDLLIWQGELEYLKELPYKLKYSSNVFTHNDDKIGENDIILLHGGGNFGDVWRLNQEFRNNIIKKFKNNKIIILPQTMHYSNAELIVEDAKIYNKHPNLVICARDSKSYDFAKVHFGACTIYQLPDSAFFLNFDNYQKNKSTGRSLLIKRLDKELGDINLIDKYLSRVDKKSLDVQDWPGFYRSGTFRKKLQTLGNIFEIKGSKVLRNSPLSFLVDDVHGLNRKDYKDYNIKKGIDFINQYDTVYSTRLHGFILAVLLNKEVYIFDNSYGKNKNFFETWLFDFEDVKLITS